MKFFIETKDHQVKEVFHILSNGYSYRLDTISPASGPSCMSGNWMAQIRKWNRSLDDHYFTSFSKNISTEDVIYMWIED